MLIHDLTGQQSRKHVLATLMFVNLGYIWSWKSDFSTHSVLDNVPRYINVF